MKVFLFLLAISFQLNCLAQIDTTGYYGSPLAIPLSMTANYGELRPNHFHMGIDFSTQGKIGTPILAVQDGIISRIKISPFGYGKVLYIDHPNGVTSVYAHCSIFKGKSDSIAKIIQNTLFNNEIDTITTHLNIQVKKGDTIALSGNSGNSTGPHLHFELRDTKTEFALNPLTNGYSIRDTKAPKILAVKIYSLTNDGFKLSNWSKIYPVTFHQNGYQLHHPKIELPSQHFIENGNLGISIETYDLVNGYEHAFSCYQQMLIHNNDTIFTSTKKAISFEGSRYINAHEDIKEYKLSQHKFENLFRTRWNTLELYPSDQLGYIPFQTSDSGKIEIIITDVNQNSSKLKFDYRFSNQKGIPQPKISSNDYFVPSSDFNYKDSLLEFNIGEGCVYEPVPKLIKSGKTCNIGIAGYQVHHPFQLKMKLQNSSIPVSKYYLFNNKALTTNYQNGWLTAESKTLGQFTIKLDTIAPTIIPLNFKESDTLMQVKNLTWKIIDNQSQLKKYDCYIDQKWVIIDFESKGNYMTLKKEELTQGEHEIEIKAIDFCGNVSYYRKKMRFE